MSYLGFVSLASAVKAIFMTKNASGTPEDATALPSFRVYGASGLMSSGTGSASFKNSGVVTGATNASPIVITSSAHGLNTGTRVTVASVGGNTAANGDFDITNASSSTFSLDGSTGNGAYTSGGTWHVSGLYEVSITPTTGNGYESGKTYTVIVTYAVDGTTKSETFTFTCV